MLADHWIETYRGTVFRWEVDANDHLTVAYYLSRFGDAAVKVLHDLGVPAAPTVECFIHYSRELRVNDLLHVESGVIGVEPEGIVLGHRLGDTPQGRWFTTLLYRLSLTASCRRRPPGQCCPRPL